MKAMVSRRYGSPDVLRLEELEAPVPRANEILVRVRATSVNAVDWHFLTGTPILVRLQYGLRRPRSPILGYDFAGRVEAVGGAVTRFAPGDEVFGGTDFSLGTFAEYVRVAADGFVAKKPAGVTFEQAAAVPGAAVAALIGLRERGRVRPGQRVLINGASGGTGTFAVQIARAMGARVTGVCSTRNVEMVRRLGAEDVVDYTREDFTRRGEIYDLLLDNVGNRSVPAMLRCLRPGGTVAVVGFTSMALMLQQSLLGPLAARLQDRFGAPAAVDNDANAGALGEFHYGAGQGRQSLLYVTVSTGVGGGWILDGNVWRGSGGMAGEIGHTVVDPAGPRCLCGKRGCVERLASGPYLADTARRRLRQESDAGSELRRLAGGRLETITGLMLSQAAARGDALVFSGGHLKCRSVSTWSSGDGVG